MGAQHRGMVQDKKTEPALKQREDNRKFIEQLDELCELVGELVGSSEHDDKDD